MTSSNGNARDDGAKAERDRQQCVDCGQSAPETETNFTLISQRHGWRLSRVVDASGRRHMEWRCPKCFAKARDRQSPKR
jgi:hypothetical protein